MLLDKVTTPKHGPLEDVRGPERIEPLRQVIWPVLHPSEKSAVDLHIVERNIRFRSWVRNAYLNRMFGNSPILREAENKFASDLGVAPTLDAVNKQFRIKDWERHPTGREDALQANLVEEYESNSNRVKEWTLEELLECVGCCVQGVNEFNLYCERNFIYEFFTRDYLRALRAHLDSTCDEIHQKSGKTEFTILEVGAGSGQLSYILQQMLHDARATKKPWTVKVVCTDTGMWASKHRAQSSKGLLNGSKNTLKIVERVAYKEALEKYQPDVVLCSWMPMGADWTEAMRATPTVEEYVLIGEKNDGCCGHPWKTWGVHIDETNDPMFAKNKADAKATATSSLDLFHWLSKVSEDPNAITTPAAQVKEEVAPYERDGFTRRDLAFSDLQLSRYDRKSFAANSHTVSFRRTQ